MRRDQADGFSCSGVGWARDWGYKGECAGRRFGPGPERDPVGGGKCGKGWEFRLGQAFEHL